MLVVSTLKRLHVKQTHDNVYEKYTKKCTFVYLLFNIIMYQIHDTIIITMYTNLIHYRFPTSHNYTTRN